MIRYILVQNRQGKTRLSKWYTAFEEEEKTKLKAEIHKLVASREGKNQSNFVEFYRVYAILDELFLGGEIQEISKSIVLARLEAFEKLD
ncbi:AP-2 complex subunit sigma [Boothiomyces sp. JEL0866]|nr:AP-2 complex subunit sigma [Boothiomyces sp. JEL0866]